jgi:formylglycine-generating enzyme
MIAPRAGVPVCVLVGLLACAASAVDMAKVTVGNPGQGGVGYTYQMGKYDVTAGQYCEFLNAVAKTDTYGLYNTWMADLRNYGCNIQRNGSSGNYSYTVPADWANRPVNDVSWGSAVRFANWLSNGQPTGAQNASTTENGSYALNGATDTASLMAVSRKTSPKWVIPTEGEWYKAAAYDPNKPGGAGFWAYATRSNSVPSNVLDPSGTNNANYYDDLGLGTQGYTIGTPYYRTEVGAFANSPSAYGTYDQGGNVYQWDEGKYAGTCRGARGGCYGLPSYNMSAALTGDSLDPASWTPYYGFRVALIPDPATLSLLALAGVGLLARRQRREIGG